MIALVLVLVILIIVMKCRQIHKLFLAVYYLLFLRLFRQLFRSKINVCVPHSCNVYTIYWKECLIRRGFNCVCEVSIKCICNGCLVSHYFVIVYIIMMRGSFSMCVV